MAITYGNTGFVTSNSFSLNNDGNFLLVGISSTSNDITAVAYNSAALAQIGTAVLNSTLGRYMTLWAIPNPSQGSNTLSITGGSNYDGAWGSISGVNLSSPYGSSITATGTSGTSAVTVTTLVPNAYAVMFQISANTGTASTNTTLFGTSSYRDLYRSTSGLKGSVTLTVTQTSTEWTCLAIAINPTTNSDFLESM